MNKNELKQYKLDHKQEYDSLVECAIRKKVVCHELECGIIDAVDAAIEIDMLKSKELKLKKKMVQAAHVTRDGEPRTIKMSQGLWCALLPGKKRLSSKTEEGLYDKLMVYYGLELSSYSIADMFEQAITEKECAGTSAYETIRRIRMDYKRYITDKFAETDIRTVTNSKLRSYTGQMLKDQNVSLNAFKNYRTMLNTIFKYAFREGIIEHNPVDSISVKEYSASCAQSCQVSDTMISEEKILSPEEIELLKQKVEWRIKQFPYYVYGYAILFSIETGVRAGEIPALKWSDVKDIGIHIHAQQLCTRENGKKEFYFVPWTKDEKKKEKKTGRLFPRTDAINCILSRIKANQEELGIQSEFIFCDIDGEPINSKNYEKCIHKTFTQLGFTVHNNHALRKSLNSNVFIRLGIPATERARMLGHSVETNLRFYSYAGKDTNEELCSLLNGAAAAKSHTDNIGFGSNLHPNLHLNESNLLYFGNIKNRKSL